MEQQTQSHQFLRQRKLFMVLPLLVLPFTTLLFWALGGGRINEAQDTSVKGFNMNLPDAYLKEDRPLDKMSYYDQAAQDSAKMKELMKNDPYYSNSSLLSSEEKIPDILSNSDKISRSGSSKLKTSPYSGGAYNDPNEAKVYEKLQQLNTALNKAPSSEAKKSESQGYSNSNDVTVNSADINRLEHMMNTMQAGNGEDPEMQQLSGMLEKILDIQHPERIKEKSKEKSLLNKESVYTVKIAGDSLKNSIPDAFKEDNSISAVIHQDQEVVSGSVVKMRLLDSIFVNGRLIPKNEFIYGICSVDAERLNIDIKTLRFGKSILPVALTAYDIDGLQGLYIPGAINRDAIKSGTENAIQNMQLMTLDPSIGAQAASAGAQAVKGLFSKKVKLIKVKLKAGYQLLLQDNNQRCKEKIMNQKNFDYLKDQVKFTGFGEGLENELKEKIARQTPEFQISHKADYGKDETEAILHFKKSNQSEMYFFNKYVLELKQPQFEDALKQTFYIGKENNITLKEGYNLMSGRAINKDWSKMEKADENDNARYIATGEKYNAWMQLDFKESDENGNFKQHKFHENYGFNLEKVLEKHPIKELANNTDKDRLMESLQKGNRQSITFMKNETEQKQFIEANPKERAITIYDSNMQRIDNKQTQAEKETQRESNTAKQENKKQSASDEDPDKPKAAKKRTKKQGQSVS